MFSHERWRQSTWQQEKNFGGKMKTTFKFPLLFALVLTMIMSLGLVAACDDDDDDDDDTMSDDDTTDDDATDDDATDDDATDDDTTDDDDDDDDDDDNDDDGTAKIRALHLSPNAGIVDIYVNNSSEFTLGLDFTEGTEYADVPAGDYTINIVPEGEDPSESVFDIPVTLDEDKSYSAVVYGALPETGTGLQAMLIVDDGSLADSGNFIAFVAHAADGVGQVDIWAILEPEPVLLLENVDYMGYGFLELAAGSYTIAFDTNDDLISDLLFVLPSLGEGEQYNVFAVLDGADVFLIAQLPDGSTVRIDPVVV